MSWLPEPVEEQLQKLIEHPEVKQLVSYLPHDFQTTAQTPEGLAIAIILSFLLSLVLLWALSATRKKRSNTILLAGPMNSGKSTLFFQLRDGSQHNGLVASMQENSGTCSLPAGKKFRALDIPGHHSSRHRLEASLKDAAGVVFVVDAVEVSPKRMDAAEMLFEVLTNPLFVKQRLPLLIACNKADLEEEAHSVGHIRKTLEKQLDGLRKSKSAGIGKDAAMQVTALGPVDKAFSFDSSLRSKVLLAECSALASQLTDVHKFISSCV